MKEAIGGVSIFQLVILFILLFTAIMCLTINHSRAYAVKDEIISLIESSNSGGSTGSLTNGLIDQIADKMRERGYRNTGDCPAGWTGYDRDGNVSTDRASFCIRARATGDNYVTQLAEECATEGCNVASGTDFPKMYYYEIALFYQLDIPLLNNMMNFRVYGSTKVLSR